jgi:hypothetical protein
VELVEETAARVSPKVASAMAVGGSRSGKAATAAMQIAREATGVRERGWPGLGWVGGSTQTRASWFSQPCGLGGLAGQMGQEANRPGGPSGFLSV